MHVWGSQSNFPWSLEFVIVNKSRASISRSSHRRYSVKEGVRPATLLKERLWRRCFPVNFGKFLRIPYLQNTFGRLLLFGAMTFQSSWYLDLLRFQVSLLAFQAYFVAFFWNLLAFDGTLYQACFQFTITSLTKEFRAKTRIEKLRAYFFVVTTCKVVTTRNFLKLLDSKPDHVHVHLTLPPHIFSG